MKFYENGTATQKSQQKRVNKEIDQTFESLNHSRNILKLTAEETKCQLSKQVKTKPYICTYNKNKRRDTL